MTLTNIFIRSQFLRRTLGTRVAAGYLRNRSVSIETALYLLTGQTPVVRRSCVDRDNQPCNYRGETK
jgi:hypothetical protein